MKPPRIPERLRRSRQSLVSALPWVAGVLLVLVLFLGLVLPRARGLLEARHEQVRLESTLRRALGRTQILSGTEIQSLVSDRKRARQLIPDGESFYPFLEKLRGAARGLGVGGIRYFRATVQPVDTDELLTHSTLSSLEEVEAWGAPPLRGLPVKIRLACGYRDLYRFLGALGSLPRRVQLQGLTVERSSQSLQVEINLRIFFLEPGDEGRDVT